MVTTSLIPHYPTPGRTPAIRTARCSPPLDQADQTSPGAISDCKVVSALSAVAHNTRSGDAFPIRRAIMTSVTARTASASMAGSTESMATRSSVPTARR